MVYRNGASLPSRAPTVLERRLRRPEMILEGPIQGATWYTFQFLTDPSVMLPMTGVFYMNDKCECTVHIVERIQLYIAHKL